MECLEYFLKRICLRIQDLESRLNPDQDHRGESAKWWVGGQNFTAFLAGSKPDLYDRDK